MAVSELPLEQLCKPRLSRPASPGPRHSPHALSVNRLPFAPHATNIIPSQLYK
ncbi:hypothetical protein BGZ63DRAFT_270698 [Mariannaea sp. PMI_226]|nr:hypothetical protein BGZ63DRAFT_270698 [Mariannaea sp. PMI_226]